MSSPTQVPTGILRVRAVVLVIDGRWRHHMGALYGLHRTPIPPRTVRGATLRRKLVSRPSA
jgi:hypothetical protein